MSKDTIHLDPRQASELDFYAAKEAAAHHAGELPNPLWPGHVLDEVKAVEPDCAAYRADKLRRDALAASMRYRANMTERDVQPVVRESARWVRVANVIGGLVVLAAVAGWVVWAGWL